MPPSPGADRNLLFGILALQMDFVSRDALIAAMNAWVLDKTKPLGQILRDQGALSVERHALLDALVQEHLKQHGNDPQRSLAAVSSIRSVRQDLEQIADPDVQASLVHVSAARAALDPDATRADLSSPAARRFQILRPRRPPPRQRRPRRDGGVGLADGAGGPLPQRVHRRGPQRVL
jgi:hypothetical protein